MKNKNSLLALLFVLSISSYAQKIDLKYETVNVFNETGYGTNQWVDNSRAVQVLLDNYASRGYTLMSSSYFRFENGPDRPPRLVLIFQKIDPPAAQEIKTQLDKSLTDMETRIREQLVTQLNALPTTLDNNREFITALYNQVRAEIDARFILIEKSQGVNTLEDYKKKLVADLITEFDTRYKKK